MLQGFLKVYTTAFYFLYSIVYRPCKYCSYKKKPKVQFFKNSFEADTYCSVHLVHLEAPKIPRESPLERFTARMCTFSFFKKVRAHLSVISRHFAKFSARSLKEQLSPRTLYSFPIYLKILKILLKIRSFKRDRRRESLFSRICFMDTAHTHSTHQAL